MLFTRLRLKTYEEEESSPKPLAAHAVNWCQWGQRILAVTTTTTTHDTECGQLLLLLLLLFEAIAYVCVFVTVKLNIIF